MHSTLPFGAIALLGLLLMVTFGVWIAVSHAIYLANFGYQEIHPSRCRAPIAEIPPRTNHRDCPWSRIPARAFIRLRAYTGSPALREVPVLNELLPIST